MPPMTDEIKSKIGVIDFNVSNLLWEIQGNYRALFELHEILSDLLDNCDLNLQCIRIIPDGDGEEPVQRAIGLTDLPILEKHLLISTAITSTVAIKVLAGIFNCDFEQVASHVISIAKSEFGGMTPEQIEASVEQIVKELRNNPNAGSFEI